VNNLNLRYKQSKQLMTCKAKDAVCPEIRKDTKRNMSTMWNFLILNPYPANVENMVSS